MFTVAKTKTAYVCTDCGADHTKWQGQCVACNAWNTLSEVRLGSAVKSRRAEGGFAGTIAPSQRLSEIECQEEPRISSGSWSRARKLWVGAEME